MPPGPVTLFRVKYREVYMLWKPEFWNSEGGSGLIRPLKDSTLHTTVYHNSISIYFFFFLKPAKGDALLRRRQRAFLKRGLFVWFITERLPQQKGWESFTKRSRIPNGEPKKMTCQRGWESFSLEAGSQTLGNSLLLCRWELYTLDGTSKRSKQEEEESDKLTDERYFHF